MTQVSQPHAPGATQYWTTYAYDATGRTTSVTAPDGSVTSYVYSGNTVKVTDPAGKWKQFTMDAFGNLTSVVEPDPNLGNVTTNYTYDVLNHLTQVSMPRGTTTQTRTFNYGTPAGTLLLSASNPENGTVTYTHNAEMTLAAKTDAKNQQTQYSYDTYKRVIQIRHYPVAGGAEDTSQQVNFYYDTNPFDGGTFSQYTAGRLAAVKYGAVNIPGLNIIPQFAEWYNYTQAGGIATKRLQLSETGAGPLNFDAQYTYDGEGKMTSVTYPTTYGWNGNTLVPTPGPTYTYSFDTMSRPIGLTDANNNSLVSGVSYGPANELLGITYLNAVETRTYNNRLQLTNITAPGLNVTYNYTAGANNGKIASATDNGETIQYTYDSLNRLSSAAFAAGTQQPGVKGRFWILRDVSSAQRWR